MKIEITKPLNLQTEESIIIDMHSFVNILNILHGELEILQLMFETDELAPSTEIVRNIYKALSDIKLAQFYSNNLEKFQIKIIQNIEEVKKKYVNAENQHQVNFSVDNINSIFSILKVRFSEIISRQGKSHLWIIYNIQNLKNNFLDVFQAIEKNSKGKYRIVFNLAEQELKDYHVSMNITSFLENKILMPAVFQDIMRDLLANARKYSDPGSHITAGLLNNGEHLRFSVEDTGRGIPSEDIEKVVDFGYRATNAQNKATMGGGFGLTKAYYWVKEFGGRFWIDSQVDKGTRIDFEIPMPEDYINKYQKEIDNNKKKELSNDSKIVE